MFFLGLFLNLFNLGAFLGLELGHRNNTPAPTTPTTPTSPPQSAA
jgi:hypothetical protein